MPCCNPFDSKWSQELLSRSIETANRLHTPDSVTPSICSKDLPPPLLPTDSILPNGRKILSGELRRLLFRLFEETWTVRRNARPSRTF